MGRLLVMLLVILQASSAGGTTLSRNPFKSPLPKPGGAVAQASDDASAETGLALKGIMIIGDQALVDLGGHILAIGEEAEGYTLMSVTEEQAVFLRQGRRVVMNVYEDENEDE
jgi:hypothetical protein